MTAYEILMLLLTAFIAFNTFLTAASTGNIVSFVQKFVTKFTADWKRVPHESKEK